jgi:prevent-host-death family protein
MTKINSMDAAQNLFEYLARVRDGETIEISEGNEPSVFLVSKEMMDQLSMALDTCVRVKNQIGHLKNILEKDMLPTVDHIDEDVAKSLFPVT